MNQFTQHVVGTMKKGFTTLHDICSGIQTASNLPWRLSADCLHIKERFSSLFTSIEGHIWCQLSVWWLQLINHWSGTASGADPRFLKVGSTRGSGGMFSGKFRKIENHLVRFLGILKMSELKRGSGPLDPLWIYAWPNSMCKLEASLSWI